MAIRDYASPQKQIFGYRAEDRPDAGHICFLIDDAVERLKLREAALAKPGPGAPSYDARLLLKAGVVRGSHIITDGTKTKANASKRRVLDRSLAEKVKKQFEDWT